MWMLRIEMILATTMILFGCAAVGAVSLLRWEPSFGVVAGVAFTALMLSSSACFRHAYREYREGDDT